MPAAKPLIQDWCGVQPEDPSPIIYHGTRVKEAFDCMDGGQSAFCVTYLYVVNGDNDVERHPGFQRKQGVRSFLDSGAFSFLAQKGKIHSEKQCIDYYTKYAEWLKTNRKGFDFYITFDYRVDARLVYAVTKQLRKLGVAPTPVYHGDDSLDWLKRYADDGYKLICLSKRNFLGDRTRLRQYYDQCFSVAEKFDLRFHGLASGLGEEVWDFPWYSIDSTSVITVGSKLCSLILPTDAGIRIIKLGERTGEGFDAETASACEERGVSMKELAQSWRSRIRFNAQSITLMQQRRKAKSWTKKTLF